MERQTEERHFKNIIRRTDNVIAKKKRNKKQSKANNPSSCTSTCKPSDRYKLVEIVVTTIGWYLSSSMKQICLHCQPTRDGVCKVVSVMITTSLLWFLGLNASYLTSTNYKEKKEIGTYKQLRRCENEFFSIEHWNHLFKRSCMKSASYK